MGFGIANNPDPKTDQPDFDIPHLELEKITDFLNDGLLALVLIAVGEFSVTVFVGVAQAVGFVASTKESCSVFILCAPFC